MLQRTKIGVILRVAGHLRMSACHLSADDKTFKIYTKTGDKGKSSLFTGERRRKSDEIFEALGTIDELSSHIGLAKVHAINDAQIDKQLMRIQCILQDVGSVVATPSSSARETHQDRVAFDKNHIDELEQWTDEYTKDLPPLKNFILPGGSLGSASLHVARTVCRRAERRLVHLKDKNEVDGEALKYLNRLSDYLFTLARHVAQADKVKEDIYIRPGPITK